MLRAAVTQAVTAGAQRMRRGGLVIRPFVAFESCTPNVHDSH